MLFFHVNLDWTATVSDASPISHAWIVQASCHEDVRVAAGSNDNSSSTRSTRHVQSQHAGGRNIEVPVHWKSPDTLLGKQQPSSFEAPAALRWRSNVTLFACAIVLYKTGLGRTQRTSYTCLARAAHTQVKVLLKMSSSPMFNQRSTAGRTHS
jgi:hypothetical protein